MRQPDIIRPVKLTTTLPEDIRAQLDIHLFSDLEGRVPKGAYQQFFIERIREFFGSRTLNLADYCPIGRPVIVRGTPEAIALLDHLLTN